MASTPPIYKDHGRTYRADTCAAVERGVAAGEVRLVALARGQYPGSPLPRNGLPGLKSVGYWDADQDLSWGLDWHRNEGLEITLLETGSLAFGVDGTEHRLQPDSLTFTRPWQLHRVGDPSLGPGRLHWVILDVGVRRPHQTWRWPDWVVITRDDLRELTEMLRQNEQAVWSAGAELRQCFQRIGRAVQSDQDGSSISRLAVLLNELLVLVLDLLRQQEVVLEPALSSSRRTVELFWNDLAANREHLAHDWTVRAMARRCGLGITRFVHHCKQLTNMTPVQYLNHCRVEAAARMLLEQPRCTITEVAMACGFSSSQYFATVFRRHFGCSPRDYRTVEVS